jgi:hypothetical protein
MEMLAVVVCLLLLTALLYKVAFDWGWISAREEMLRRRQEAEREYESKRANKGS